MRAGPAEMTTVATASRNIIHLSPPLPSTTTLSPSSCEFRAHNCRWWPYSTSNDFAANTATVLIILLCALICALALNTAIRCFLRRGGGGARHHSPSPTDGSSLPQTQQQKPNLEALVVAPTLVYSAGMKLGGEEADCAICLSEFMEGEGIRVLGKCKHGFHVHCIQQWLSTNFSCPTCRSSCLASSPSSPNNVTDCCSPDN